MKKLAVLDVSEHTDKSLTELALQTGYEMKVFSGSSTHSGLPHSNRQATRRSFLDLTKVQKSVSGIGVENI